MIIRPPQQGHGCEGEGVSASLSVSAGAALRETKTLKPIDNVSLGKTTSRRAVMKVNANVASKVRSPEGRAHIWRAKAAWGAEI